MVRIVLIFKDECKKERVVEKYIDNLGFDPTIGEETGNGFMGVYRARIISYGKDYLGLEAIQNGEIYGMRWTMKELGKLGYKEIQRIA